MGFNSAFKGLMVCLCDGDTVFSVRYVIDF